MPNAWLNRCRAVLVITAVGWCFAACHTSHPRPQLVVGSKFFTEQVVLAELLAQHIEARAGLVVERKTNLGGTLLVQKALLAGELDMYVEYTGTALTAVLNESVDPNGAANGSDPSRAVFERVKDGYEQRFQLAVCKPLGFENTFAMVIRGEDAQALHLRTISDMIPRAPKWRVGVGYEFQERPDGYAGWVKRYGLQFSGPPLAMDLGLIYRALTQKQVDLVAGNSTDGLIDVLNLVALEDDKHYFPPYDAVPVVRDATLARYPQLRGAIDELAGKISAADIRKMNYAVDGLLQDPKVVVKQFREEHGL